MVLCTLIPSMIIFLGGWDIEYLVLNAKRQSRRIFVEMHVKNATKGAEHRNIQSQPLMSLKNSNKYSSLNSTLFFSRISKYSSLNDFFM